MTEVERLAQFAVRASYDGLSDVAREQLTIRVLDAIGCAIGALGGEPVQLVRAYAASAGIARALGLDVTAAANALAISGAALNALRATRTGRLSHWKGLAYPNTAANCIRLALLARRGVMGSARSIGRQQGIHAGDRRPVCDRLGA